jgi:LysR family transcriptional regulator, transcriptional activator of nhaA
VAYRYADEIFGLGQEMVGALKGRAAGRPTRLVVGVANVLPKLIAYRLLSPVLTMADPVQITCHEDASERLVAELALHNLDVVLADAPLSPSVRVLAYNHLLGECGTSIMAAPALAPRYRRGFPRSLDQAPWLLPTANTALRRRLHQWFDAEGVRPAVCGEFGNSALLKAFGQHGIGVFAVPTAVEDEVRRQYRVQLIGRLPAVREQFYLISIERKLKHPAIVAISHAARRDLFG